MIDDHVLRDLGSLSDEALFEKLGRSLEGDGLHVRPQTPEESERAGRSYFTDQLDTIRGYICGEPRVLAATARNDENDLVVCLCDILIVAYTGLPLATICVLVARLGVSRICAPG